MYLTSWSIKIKFVNGQLLDGLQDFTWSTYNSCFYTRKSPTYILTKNQTGTVFYLYSKVSSENAKDLRTV